MKAFIETYNVKVSEGCYVFKLRNPIDGKLFGVINYETIGKQRLPSLETGEAFCSSVEYKVGPDAIIIKEILE